MRQYTEAPIRAGHLESPWERLVAGLVLGEVAFARDLLRGWKVDLREHTAARRLRGRVGWPELVAATEAAQGQRWANLVRLHGDWARDGTLYFAVRHGGHRLAQAVRRFGAALGQDRSRQQFIAT